jgi:hypothetical protein
VRKRRQEKQRAAYEAALAGVDVGHTLELEAVPPPPKGRNWRVIEGGRRSVPSRYVGFDDDPPEAA